MKPITPVSIWSGGQTKSANNLELAIVHDNLENSATFYWQLLSVADEAKEQLAQGNLTISGEDYENWGTAEDINQAAFVWAADQLNLQLS